MNKGEKYKIVADLFNFFSILAKKLKLLDTIISFLMESKNAFTHNFIIINV